MVARALAQKGLHWSFHQVWLYLMDQILYKLYNNSKKQKHDIHREKTRFSPAGIYALNFQNSETGYSLHITKTLSEQSTHLL